MNLPNKLTILRIFMIPAFMFLLLYQSPNYQFWAAIVFILASLTDTLDGHIARKYNLITNFGKFMDPLADKLLVTSAFLAFVEMDILPAWFVMVILAREFAITGIRTLAAKQGVVIAASKWGKMKTISQMVAIIVVLFHNFGLAFPLDQVLLYIALALTILSGADYIVKNIRLLKETD